MLGNVVIGKRHEMFDQFLDLVLLAAVRDLVKFAEHGITTVFAVLLGLLGLVQTRHDGTSIKRAGLPYVLIMEASFDLN